MNLNHPTVFALKLKKLVAGIISIATDALNNVDPVPEPGVRYGAGGVRRFAPVCFSNMPIYTSCKCLFYILVFKSERYGGTRY